MSLLVFEFDCCLIHCFDLSSLCLCSGFLFSSLCLLITLVTFKIYILFKNAAVELMSFNCWNLCFRLNLTRRIWRKWQTRFSLTLKLMGSLLVRFFFFFKLFLFWSSNKSSERIYFHFCAFFIFKIVCLSLCDKSYNIVIT